MLWNSLSSLCVSQLCSSLRFTDNCLPAWCMCLLFLIIFMCADYRKLQLRLGHRRKIYEGHLFCPINFNTIQLPPQTLRDVSLCSLRFNSAVWEGQREDFLSPPHSHCDRLFHFADSEPLVSMGDSRLCRRRRLIKSAGGFDQRRKYTYPADPFSCSLRFNLRRLVQSLQAERQHAAPVHGSPLRHAAAGKQTYMLWMSHFTFVLMNTFSN